MPESKAKIIQCEACQKRVAEIIASDGRCLCSTCHLTETGARRLPKDEGQTKE